jgi:hypothetical protein
METEELMRTKRIVFLAFVLMLGACGGGQAPAPPSGLHSAVLTWTEAQSVAGFYVYRDGARIGAPAQPTYTDTPAPAGEHGYYVTAFNTDGESAPSDTVTVLIPQ